MAIIEGSPFQQSANRWDWLGEGVYFWQDDAARAWQWADEHISPPEDRSVIEAQIDLGTCLDLCGIRFMSLLAQAYFALKASYDEAGESLPSNKGSSHGLDNVVVNFAAGTMLRADSVRGLFHEGEPVYPEASFTRLQHIQVCVRSEERIQRPLRLVARGGGDAGA